MKSQAVVALLLASFLTTSATAQNKARMDETLRKYFVSLPYGKKMGDWLDEHQRLPGLRLDSFRKELRSTNDLLLYGVLPITALFPDADSLRIMVGQMARTQSTSVNGNITRAWQDTSFYLDHVYYFPREGMTWQDWKSFGRRC